MYKKMIRMAMMCASETCIVPLQDWAGLDNSARMNAPYIKKYVEERELTVMLMVKVVSMAMVAITTVIM